MAEQPAPQAAADDGQPAPETGAMDLTALVVAHHAAVYRFAHRLCGCPIEAEDLTQQTFLIARQKLDQIREPQRACAWLLAVTRSCFLKSIRKPRPLPAENIELLVEVATQSTNEEEIDGEQLAAALAELPEEFRLVVVMFYFEELSYQEIADELQIPVGTVMSRLSRGKSHLRRRLAPPEPTKSIAISAPRAVTTGKPANVRASAN